MNPVNPAEIPPAKKRHVTVYWFFPVDWTANAVCRYMQQREEQVKKLRPEIYWSNERVS